MIITNNSPSAGYIAWQDVVVKHKNLSYNVNNGNSNKKYIWWDFSTPTVLQETDTMPTMTDNDAIIFYNDSGTYHIASVDTDIHGGLLITGTVPGSALIETYVETTGNESIAGVKTFEDFPVLPSDNPTTDFQAAHKKYVDNVPPAAHHTSHESGGGDAIKLDDLDTPDDNTDLDASDVKHGLLRKLTNAASQWLDASGNFTTPKIIGQFVFTVPDTLTTGTNKTLELFAATALTITEVAISVKTAPTGASIIVDVNKNGTTIFTTQGNRPEIAIDGTFDTSGTPDVTALAKNDKLTIDIDQIGSGTAGADLTVMVRFEQEVS